MNYKTKDLYEVAFLTFVGAKVIRYYGTRTLKTYELEVKKYQLLLRDVFEWLWCGLRDKRIELKNESYHKSAQLVIKAEELRLKPDKKELRDARVFLERWEQLNGRVCKR